MSREIRGRHILGGIALAALVSLPFDAMIVSGMLTEIRMERAFRAADARAAKRAHDRAIADTVSAAPQPDTSALISRAQAEETTEESSPAVGGAVVSRDGGTTEAGAAAESGVGAVSHPAPRTRTRSRLERLPSFGRAMASAQGVRSGETLRTGGAVSGGFLSPGSTDANVSAGVTLGRDRGFACCQSSLSAGTGKIGSTQSVRSVRSPLVHITRLGVSEQKAGGGRPISSDLYEVTAYSHGCTLPRSGREPHPQRAANGRWPIADHTVAADTTVHPFGSEVLIEGLGFRTVGDRGSAIKGRRLDLFVDSCREARAFGRRFLRVFPVPPATTREARGFDMEPTR